LQNENEEESREEGKKSKSSGKFIVFKPYFNVNKKPKIEKEPEYAFKFSSSLDIKLIRHTLEFNGFKEITGN
jgi:hypothetical protein